MGRPSDQRRSAQRPGRRERMRLKSSVQHGSKGQCWTYVAGAEFASGPLGQKHLARWRRWVNRQISILRREPNKPESQ